ncbi:ABC transporter substrate-binding protein [Streptomyces noursei]|uniref:Sugar ABC transporter substrate-binding protein n=1 Tax=Streptomyces noursei TaxID=1971 RepID=A0A401QX19_STRNR|nr:sugar ABC transporter substrate-binding protein [Streptomyces noursei ZPM]EOT03351.1 sugar ABC transporter substrate-binding protein [Streptomyces noursei CCRC 11814]EXU90531.1 sugar ABC transporter substrate-binding protein [Streptomyces noursei PD-1]GCB89910.1 sugar ABC transporter substrate-binding protein [Streptomyces noursei]
MRARSPGAVGGTGRRGRWLAAVVAALSLATAGCYRGAGGTGDDGPRTLNVLMVNNPQMVDLQRLTAEHFTKETGIRVHFTVLPEDDLRDKMSQDFSSQAGQYDVASLSNYETPIYARNGWLTPLGERAAKDPQFDQKDLLAPVRSSLTAADGEVYAEPFYGESSFLMYRKDLFEAAGLTMPAHPTWSQVAAMAAKLDGSRKGLKGICLRGQPGWGQLTAPLTTVVNTFGGTWFDKDWQARVDSPEFARAARFYVGLLRAHGEPGAPQAGYTECLNDMQQGKVAMWYDATAGAGSLESADSPVAGRIGYAPAPVERTASAGWLYTWAWGIQKASTRQEAAWEFVRWASGKAYEELAGRELGWSRVPAGKRASLYRDPDYLKEAGAFAGATERAITSARPDDPGVQPRPAPGIQFVGIPEFSDLGTKVSQEISAAIAGKQSVDDALRAGQRLAREVSDAYTGR